MVEIVSRIRNRAAVERRRADVARFMSRAAIPPTPPPQAAQPKESRTMKAKVHAVELQGETHLVMARTKAGARRDLVEYIIGDAHVEIATGEQIYRAGREGREIIGVDKYARSDDPNQMPLDGVSEAVDDGKPAAPF